MKIHNPKEKIPWGHVGPEFMFRIATGRKTLTKTEKFKILICEVIKWAQAMFGQGFLVGNNFA